jgi:hypothetical protein
MFLNSWAELDSSSQNLRTKQLLDLQKTAELQVCAFTGLIFFFFSFWKKIMESVISVILLSFEGCASNRFSGKKYYLNLLLEVDK